MEKINRYTKKEEYSYTLGAFPTLELIDKRPDLVKLVYIHDNFYEKEDLINTCRNKGIDYEISSKQVNRLSNKENTLVVGVFNKFYETPKKGDHIVLNEVSDMGNLGTIIRTMNGFNFNDLILIGNVCDVFNPKTVRASMGSIFDMRIRHFNTIEEYMETYGKGRDLYLFMLSKNLKDSLYNTRRPDGKFSLIFGNEGSGLPASYEKFGRKVFIPQSDKVDSFNLPIACAIAMYEFNGSRGEI